MLKKIIAATVISTSLLAVGCSSMPSAVQQEQNLTLLQNKTWIMTHIGATEYKIDPSAQNVPSIQFHANDMRVSGTDGCNRLMANYTVKGNQISFGPMAGTKMMCPDSMELSSKYTEALSKVAGYQVYGHTLKLLDRHGNIVLKYVSAMQPR